MSDLQERLAAVLDRHLPCAKGNDEAAMVLRLDYHFPLNAFHAAPIKKDLAALAKLERALAQVAEAISELSQAARSELNARKRQPKEIRHLRGRKQLQQHARLFGPIFGLQIHAEALESAFAPARAAIEKRRDAGRAKLGPVAVVAACESIWESRMGQPAPRVRDNQPGPPLVPFEAFARDVFDVFGIVSRIDSAQARLAEIREKLPKTSETPE